MLAGVREGPRKLSFAPIRRTGPAGPDPPPTPRALDLLSRALAVPSGKPVLVSGRSTWTREALSAAVERRARELKGDVRPGRIHPTTLHADPAGILELLAAWSLGGVVAPLSPQLSRTERSKAVLALQGAERSDPLPRDVAAVLWTSGTTGKPRGVALTEAGLVGNAAAARARLRLTSDDVWYASLSLAHVGGLALVTRALLMGSALVARGRFDLDRLAAALRGEEAAGPATHISLVPTQLHRLLDRWGTEAPPSSLRCVLVGGAAIPTPLLERALEAGWPLALTYGMTEMTSQVATAAPDRVREKPGTVGGPLKGIQLRIAEDGEVLLKGRTRAAGYVAGDEPLTGPDGWYHSGDLGRLDGDGDLWILGRKSDRIQSGGVTVDPHEVEAVLRENPAIRDVCVVGIPDEEWGERVAALVVPAGSGLDQGRLDEWAWGRLGAARLPRVWRVANRLPLNRNGKVDREAVRALFEG